MSGYLMRLATRAQLGEMAPSLRPFVRSASPVLERDQRLATLTPESPLPSLSSDDLGTEHPELPSTTTAGHFGDRGPQTGAPQRMPVATPLVSSSDDTEVIAHDQAARFQKTQASILARSSTPVGGNAVSQPMIHPVSVDDVSGIDPGSGSSMPAAESRSAASEPYVREHMSVPPTPDSIEPRRSGAAWRVAEAAGARSGEPNRRLAPRSEQLAGLRPPDVEVLRPTERFPQETSVPAAYAAPEELRSARGPRVVIGRIDVEVVPTRESEARSKSTASKPLTASSSSVIGPLRSDASSVRLGLRYR